MALTSPLVALHRRLFHCRSDAQPDQDAHWDEHEPEVIIAGFGRFGQVVGRMLTSQHVPFTAMDKDPAHVEFVKKFGNRLYFGDLTRLDILQSAGIESARTLVVAVDNIEESLKIVDQARELNPDVRIVARAIDRFHAYELHARKVESVIRETFPSSLEAGTSTLLNLGYTDGQALQVADRFRRYDEALLQKSVAHKDDMDELLTIAREGRMELEHLFEEDKKDPVSA
ncbi:MAG: NAD-binding protein [Pseudohongiellaceae bacterium]